LTLLLATDEPIVDAKGSRDEILGKRADLTDAVYSRIEELEVSLLQRDLRRSNLSVEASYLPCGSYGA
jgi:hypothetical protein